jgi:UDP-N-acetylglucosamine 4,6-dehydratase
VNREEMAKAFDMGNYYRVPADNRDLNYASYFSEGQQEIATIDDYHSHNTHRLDVEGTKELLMKLPIIRRDVLGENAKQYPD